jgi:hypothetical protein
MPAAPLGWPCCPAAIARSVPLHHGRLSDTPQDDVRISIQRSHGLLSNPAQRFDALDARSNLEPIKQSVRDLDKLHDA